MSDFRTHARHLNICDEICDEICDDIYWSALKKAATEIAIGDGKRPKARDPDLQLIWSRILDIEEGRERGTEILKRLQAGMSTAMRDEAVPEVSMFSWRQPHSRIAVADDAHEHPWKPTKRTKRESWRKI